MLKQVMAVMLMGSMLTACASETGGADMMTRSDGRVSKQGVGTIAGAIGGGIIGSNVGKGKGAIAGTIVGTLLGAGLGSSIGASMDRGDLAYYNRTSQSALENAPSGQAMPWKNPDTGNYGTVTPMNYSQNSAGQYCREYSQTINVGGKSENAYGKACRQPDGSWQVIN